jgi:hypothetical protein
LITASDDCYRDEIVKIVQDADVLTDTRFEEVNSRLKGLDSNMKGMESKIKGLESNMQTVMELLLDLRSEIKGNSCGPSPSSEKSLYT